MYFESMPFSGNQISLISSHFYSCSLLTCRYKDDQLKTISLFLEAVFRIQMSLLKRYDMR